jgi:hypothetical protein
MTRPRKRPDPELPPEASNGTAVLPPSDTSGSQDTPTTTSPSEPPSDTNGYGNGQERKPVQVFSYLVSRDTYIQASIWDRVVTLSDGTEFTAHDVTVRKRYRDARDGDWKTLYSFRGSEIYAVLHALSQASAWILEARASASSCPF